MMVINHDATAQALEASEVIDGRYHVIRELGRGAMGVVVHVHDPVTSRELALKQLVLHDDGIRAERSIVRFRREFHTIVGLRHPCVVEAYEYGIDGERPYYTMELLEGPTLHDRLKADILECCRLLRDVASALAFLHSRRLLHRDLKPGNVRCDATGRPKLLDFGVLATMGVIGEVAGTPPGIPPEALRGLPLDGRSDLYGLGTLAYRLLTGRQAFPADSIGELEKYWSQRPQRPAALRPEVPEALDELVMALLAVEPMSRPGSAVDVIARLDLIGGLKQAPELEVARGWLQSARLVGRASEVQRIQAAVDQTVGGQGTMIVLEGPAGVGKTRLLHEAGLNAQIAGVALLRARFSGGSNAPYDVVQQLVRDMLRTCPKHARLAGQRRSEVIGRIWPEFARDEHFEIDIKSQAPPAEQRLWIQQELLEWFLTVSKARPLMLIVDELERCDDRSAALLRALAHLAPEHSIAIVGALRSGPEESPTSRLFRGVGEHMRLGELESVAVAELVHDWFGDLSGAAQLADWVQQTAGGNPLYCFELARHLVEQGIVLYSEGMWHLVADPEVVELPAALADTMDLRVEMLSGMGRALGQALALWRGAAPIELCTQLFGGQSAAPLVFEAIDELVYEEIIVGEDGGFELLHDGVRDALLRSLKPEDREQIHRSTAELIVERWGPEGGEHGADLGWHLLKGGRKREGAAQLERIGRELFASSSFEDAIPLLEGAFEVYRSSERRDDRSSSMELQALLVKAGVVCDRAVAIRYADAVIEYYAGKGGLWRARSFSRFFGRTVGLLFGLMFTHLLWVLGGRKGPSPHSAMVMTVTLASYVASLHALCFHATKVDSICHILEPLRSIRTPAGQASTLMFDGFADIASGRWGQSIQVFDHALQNVEQLDQTSLSEIDRRMFLGGALALKALAQVIEQDPQFDGSQKRLRSLDLRLFNLGSEMIRIYFHRLRGEEDRAAELIQAAEVGMTQLGNAWTYEIVRAWISTIAYGLSDDVVGLRRMVDELERLDRSGLQLSSFVALAQAELARSQGDPAGACALLQSALAHLEPAQGMQRVTLLAALVDALLAHQQPQEAMVMVERALADAEQGIGLRVVHIRLRCARALCLARLGREADAEKELARLIAPTPSLDNPLLLGLTQEVAAKVAELEGDETGQRHHAAHAELLFASTGNEGLIARARRLVVDARVSLACIVPLPESEVIQVSDALDTVDLQSDRSLNDCDPLTDEAP